MTYVRDLIIARSESTFQRYQKDSLRRLKETSPELLEEFERQKDFLNALIKETVFWHGTGKYHYAKQGNSKYEGVSHQRLVDVLDSICEAQGLLPHYDPWAEKFVRVPHSISLANNWSYGKIYAHNFQDEATSLKYEVAPLEFWYWLNMKIQFTENKCKFALGFTILYLFSRTLQKQGKIWLSTYRSDIEKRWPFWRIMMTPSDIKGNYSLYFGIKEGLQTEILPKILRFLETRTSANIPFSNINFIAVPHNQVDEVVETLARKKVTLPVVSLELLELAMSHYTLRQIMYQSYE